MSLDEEKVKLLLKEKRKLCQLMDMFYNDVLIEEDSDIDREKLQKTFKQLRKVQNCLLENAIENEEDTEPLMKEKNKYAKLMKDITNQLKGETLETQGQSESKKSESEEKPKSSKGMGKATMPESDPDECESEESKPKPRQGKGKPKKVVSEPEESEPESDKSKPKKGKGKPTNPESDPDESEPEPEESKPKPRKGKSKSKKVVSEPEESEPEADYSKPKKGKGKPIKPESDPNESEPEENKPKPRKGKSTSKKVASERESAKPVKQKGKSKESLPPSDSETMNSSEEEEDEPMDIPEDEELNRGPARELNILLLGETGSGKSTTINALANYLLYASFNKATTGEFKQLIPSKFTLPDPVTGAPYEIQLGKDANESHEVTGNSVTQEPRGYVFPFGNTTIRIIDTPGMGDTRGAKVDNENFEKILQHLTLYKELHGICILVKATETRKTNSFRYCINELLTYLHKDAVKNMVFLFTFSRNSFYGPGEGFSTLKSFLGEELRDAHIQMVSNGLHANCFFIDNEAFRYLVAKKTGYKFSSNQERSYRESWHTSVEQTMNMFNRFLTERPHTLESTLSLNHARKVILQLAEPLARLQSKNSGNIKILKEKEASLKDTTKSKEDLARGLHVQIDDLAAKELDLPYTVCSANCCTEVLVVNNERKVDYKQKCHEPCYLSGVEAKKIGHPSLENCFAINDQGNCDQCGCHWQLHMHTEFDFYRVKRTIVDVNKQREIKNADDAILAIEDFMAQSKRAVLEFEHEMKVIHDVSAFFACILINYSNSPYNRFLEPHLNMLIDEEEKKINASGGSYSREAKEKLIEMLNIHRENVKTMQKAIDSNKRANVELKDIDSQLERLKNLKHTGPDLVRIMQTFDRARVGEIAKTASYSAFDPNTTVSSRNGKSKAANNKSQTLSSRLKNFVTKKVNEYIY